MENSSDDSEKETRQMKNGLSVIASWFRKHPVTATLVAVLILGILLSSSPAGYYMVIGSLFLLICGWIGSALKRKKDAK